jgi:hypothetical protein
MDAIWALSLDLPDESESLKALAGLVSKIDSGNLVDRNILMKCLPENLLDSANVEKKHVLKKQVERAYRKLHYDQKKYNLLR